MQAEYDPSDFWKPKDLGISEFEPSFNWECPYTLQGYNDNPIDFLEKEIQSHFDALDLRKKEKRLCINGIVASSLGIVTTIAVTYTLFPSDMKHLAYGLYELFTRVA